MKDKQDIRTRADVEQLVDAFYRQVVEDATIGRFFTEVVELSWDRHMPVMYAFWSSVLLGEAGYTGNPIHKHILLDKLARLEKKHFDRWLALWEMAVDAQFEGPKAEEAKARARHIAQLILFKVEQSRGEGFIQ